MKKKEQTSIDFDTLFEQYNSYVYKIVINESDNKLTKEDIEETVSDIFFLLWKNYKKIKDDSKIKSYIGTIAKNTTKNKLRTLKNEVSLDENDFWIGKNNENLYHINEQLNLIQKELETMEDIDREVFRMYYYENKKIKDIAKIKDLKVSNIKVRLHRIKKKLKKSLKRED